MVFDKVEEVKMQRKLLVLALFFAVSAIIASAQVGEGKNIQITLVNQEPDPVEPGSYATLRFKIENWGSENAEGMVFELLPEQPFSLDSGTSPQKYVGSVWGRQKGDLGAIVKYRVKVDETSGEGISEIDARYKLEGWDWIKVGPYNISVKTTKAVLAIRDVEIEPGTIAPGSSANITVFLQNTAKSLIRNIVVKLDFSSSPNFAPVGYNEKVLAPIRAGETAKINFLVAALPGAAAGVYKIPLALTYVDELNNEYSRNGTLGIVIGSKPELDVQIEASNLYTKNSAGEISIKFVNKGLTGIKFLNVKLLGSEEYEILSPDKFYIGEIDSDDYEIAEFRIYPVKNDIKLPIEIDYMDANNIPYSEKKEISLKLYSASEASKLGLKKNNGTGIMLTIAIIVLGILAYYLWKKTRK